MNCPNCGAPPLRPPSPVCHVCQAPPAQTGRWRKLSPRSQLLWILVVSAVVIVVLVAMAQTDEEETGDQHSRLACSHFRNVAGDVARGVLTDAELRGKLKQVDANASIATPQVQRAASAMLAAMTTGTSTELVSSFREMDTACEAAGW